MKTLHPPRSLRGFLTVACLGGAICSPRAATAAPGFAKGADVGWLTQMEASNVKFFNVAGTQEDCLQIMRELGMNSIRLRVWVNPASGWNGQPDVVNKAVRAANLGFRLMIDFHYSDTWADPAHQAKPAAWSAHNLSQLNADVTSHTTAVLTALKTAGVTPEWVQVGNETNDGMLWEDGRASTSMASFAGLVTSGYDAVKAVFPDAKVVVHISNGYDNALFRWMFDGLTTNGAKFDVIGMSLYPSTSNWATLDAQCLANMNDMVARYGKDVIVSEVGMDVNSPSIARSFLTDIIRKTRSVSGGHGLGVLYWEPESYGGWQAYTLGAFGSDGRPTIALDAFKLNPPADFNSDGHADILWQNTATGERDLWLMNGTQSASAVPLGTVALAWSIAGIADFNGDGQPDLLWENTTTGERYLWLMNGTQFASGASLGTVAAAWSIVGTGDFNGDGQPDIVWENSATGERYVWLMNGPAYASNIFLGVVPKQWHIAATADFDGDGQNDVVWENTATGERYLWLMNGTTYTSSVFLGVVPTNWAIAGTGDFNGDGHTDLIWQNTSTGDRVIWLMNGTAFQSSVYLTVISTDWSIRN